MSDPAQWDLTVRKNVAWSRALTVQDNEGAPIDLTGFTALMQIRLYQGADDPALIELTDVASEIEGVEFSDPAAGELIIRIDKATLEALPDTVGRNKPSTFHHDLIISNATADPVLVLFGSFTVYTGVSR